MVLLFTPLVPHPCGQTLLFTHGPWPSDLPLFCSTLANRSIDGQMTAHSQIIYAARINIQPRNMRTFCLVFHILITNIHARIINNLFKIDDFPRPSIYHRSRFWILFHQCIKESVGAHTLLSIGHDVADVHLDICLNQCIGLTLYIVYIKHWTLSL